MKLGIIGLPRAGKSTVFDALTKNISGAEHKGEDRIAAIRVPDDRVDALSRMFKPQKTIYALKKSLCSTLVPDRRPEFSFRGACVEKAAHRVWTVHW